MFDLIVAHDNKKGIGKYGIIPWYYKDDLEHFKETTLNSIVIMGRKTWESIPDKFKPLQNRINVVISRNNNISKYKDVYYYCSLDEALNHVIKFNKKIFIIGGSKLYNEAIKNNQCKNLIITRINDEYSCDVFFPDYEKIWKEEKIIKKTKDFQIIKYKKI